MRQPARRQQDQHPALPHPIPLAARVFAVIDVWDALSYDRPYRGAWPQEKVVAYLKDQSGKHFDPEVLEAFLKMLGERG